MQLELGLGLTHLIPLLLYLFGIIVVILTLFYRIEVGIFFAVPLIPLQNILDVIHKYPLGKDFLDILILAMVVKWILNKRREGQSIFVRTPFNLLILLLALWTYIGLWHGCFRLGLPPPTSIRDPRFMLWKNFMFLPLLYFIIVNNIRDLKHVKVLVILVTLSMLAMDRNFLNAFNRPTHFTWDVKKSSGTFTYLGANELSVFYAFYSPILLSLFLLDKNKWRKILFATTAFLNYYVVLFLFSRSGYLLALVGLVFIGLVREKWLLVALVIFLLIWRVAMPLSVQERIDMTRTEEGYDSTTRERFGMWEQGLEVLSDNLTFGAGFGVTPHLRYTDGMSKVVRKSLHNGLLQMATEMGIIGLGICLAIFLLAIRAGWLLYKVAEHGFSKGLGLGFIICGIVFVFGNAIGNVWFYSNVVAFYWVFLALVVRSTIMIQQGSSSESTTKSMNI